MRATFPILATMALTLACAHHKPAPVQETPPAPVALGAGSVPAAAAISVALSTGASVQELLTGIEAAYRAGRFNDGLTLVKRTLETRRKDLSIYDRVGSVYYLLGRYGEAMSVWEQALKLEKRPKRREDLRSSIAMARRTLGLPEPPETPPAKKRPKPPRRAHPKTAPDPKQVEWFYDQGVAHYARGEYLQAASDFYRVLELDPEHQLAKSALARLKLKPGAVDTGKNGNPL